MGRANALQVATLRPRLRTMQRAAHHSYPRDTWTSTTTKTLRRTYARNRPTPPARSGDHHPAATASKAAASEEETAGVPTAADPRSASEEAPPPRFRRTMKHQKHPPRRKTNMWARAGTYTPVRGSSRCYSRRPSGISRPTMKEPAPCRKTRASLHDGQPKIQPPAHRESRCERDGDPHHNHAKRAPIAIFRSMRACAASLPCKRSLYPGAGRGSPTKSRTKKATSKYLRKFEDAQEKQAGVHMPAAFAHAARIPPASLRSSTHTKRTSLKLREHRPQRVYPRSRGIECATRHLTGRRWP